VVAEISKATAAGSSFSLTFPDGAVVDTFLPIPGEHMVGNAALAAAVAWHSGVEPQAIAEALGTVRITRGRLDLKKKDGVTYLDDSYNANPDSMKAGLRTLAGLECNGRRVAVLGRMGELGELAEEGHRAVGAYAGEMGLDAVFTVGENEAALIHEAATVPNKQHFVTHALCADFLTNWLVEGDVVLVKGSRSARMEEVLALLSVKS
jgi:UDP-N-acetylmuramoyl-tripeptide--D-alanyl-D-alanine ligase